VTTHYDVLGVSARASADQIKRAYYRRARSYHPDGHAGSSVAVLEEAQRAMAGLNAAWHVLRDPKARKAYDETLARLLAPPKRTNGGSRRVRDEEDGGKPPRLEIGSGFRYWMASVGPIRREGEHGSRMSLAVDGARDLAPLRTLAPDRLYALHAGHTAVDDAQLRHLHGMTGLLQLDLTGTRVTDAGLIHLLGLESLESLSLWRTQITDRGLELLARLPALRVLGLGETAVTDAGLAALGRLGRLRILQLWGTGVTGPGLRHLHDLGDLEIVSLPRGVRGRHRRRLRAAVPAVLVV
jgi:DnaJ-domain-containing protein 1